MGRNSRILLLAIAVAVQTSNASCTEKQPSGVFVIRDGASSNYKLIYLSNGTRHLVLTTTTPIFFPVLSPDQDRIAFARDVPQTVADAELDTVQTNGQDLTRMLVDPDPFHINYIGIQVVTALGWLGHDRLVLVGINNPSVNIGYITDFKTQNGEPIRVFPDDHDDRQGNFEDDGPLTISPGGVHVASVGGAAQSAQYTACTQAAAGIEIDGVHFDYPRSLPYSNFSWHGDTELSVVVRQVDGYRLLTVSGIPPEPLPNTLKTLDGITHWNEVVIPVAKGSENTVSFDLYRTEDGRVRIVAQAGPDGQSRSWIQSGASLVEEPVSFLDAHPELDRQAVIADKEAAIQVALTGKEQLVSGSVACLKGEDCSFVNEMDGVHLPAICVSGH